MSGLGPSEYGFARAICGQITLRNFYGRPFGSVWAQVDDMQPTGVSGFAVALEPGYAEGELSGGFGRWSFGTLGERGEGADDATVQWTFERPVGVTEFTFSGRVLSFEAELCDGEDNDCDGEVDEDGACDPPDPPAWVSASDALDTEYVFVTWAASDEATGYEILRDGVLVQTVGAVTSWQDDGALAGTVDAPGSPTASSDRTGDVLVTWTEPFSLAGAPSLYTVRAIGANGTSAESAGDFGNRLGGALTGYEVRIDGGSWIPTGSTATSWNDVTAPAGAIVPGTVAASDGDHPGWVALSVSGWSSVAGTSRTYEVRALSGTQVGAASGPVPGNRVVGTMSWAWDRSAADSDAGYSGLAGATSAFHLDTTAPASGEGRWFRVTAAAPGAAPVSGSDRGFRTAPGYFVRTSTAVSMPMGGLSGANATCLANLTANDWMGKSDAVARGLLTSDYVRAFLCTTDTCQNGVPYASYRFAQSSEPAVGGHQFSVNGAGSGPGDTVAWNSTDRFGATNRLLWTGRQAGTGSAWSTLPTTTNCFNWSRPVSYNVRESGRGNPAGSSTTRWSSNGDYCSDGGVGLACFVHPVAQSAVSGTSCLTDWGQTVADGGTVTAWSTQVGCGGTCASETRTCTNGTLSGSYRHSTCTDHATCSSRGFMVATATAVTGDLGGLAGANTVCYNQVNDNTWRDKGLAGTITPDRVRAFLCDSSTCQNPVPNTVYQYATAGNGTAGGERFLSTASGGGPGDFSDWWGSGYFTGVPTVIFWTGRATGSTGAWGMSPATGYHCDNWSNPGAFGATGSLRSGGPDGGVARWGTGGGSGCTGSRILLCLVDPD